MPFTTHYVDDGKGVHKIGAGIVTGLEIFSSALQGGLDGERARKLRYGLIDFSDTTEMRVTPDDVRRIVEMNRKVADINPRAIIAIVAPADLPYAMARLWHTLSDDLGWKKNVFHTRADAVSWLCKELCSECQDGGASVCESYPSLQTEAGQS